MKKPMMNSERLSDEFINPNRIDVHVTVLYMQRAESFEKTLMLGKIESRRRKGWMASSI